MACQKRCHELFFFYITGKYYLSQVCYTTNTRVGTVVVLQFSYAQYFTHTHFSSSTFFAFYLIEFESPCFYLFIFFFLLLSPDLRVIIVAVVVAGPKSPFLYFARAYDGSHYRPQSLSGPVVSACIYVCAISNVCDPVYKTIKRRHTFISSKRKKKKNFMSQFFPSP